VPETQYRFAELSEPRSAPAAETELGQRNDLVASIRIGNASLDIYSGANAEIVATLCKVMSHAE
jgi:hypothetical protein